MRRRFRHYARQGWEVVEVDRANLYKLYEQQEFGNQLHYKEMRTWCNSTFPKDSWEATMGESLAGKKKFAFKHPKHATLFKLKWL